MMSQTSIGGRFHVTLRDAKVSSVHAYLIFLSAYCMKSLRTEEEDIKIVIFTIAL